MKTQNRRAAQAALVSLIILQGVMLAALYAGVEPHPPASTPLFGIAPFLGAAIALAASALILDPLASRAGRVLAVAAGLCALVSFGPHKYLDAQFSLIWPGVIGGQVAALTLFVLVFRAAGARRAAAA